METPVYSFKESKRVGTKTVPCPESNVILVEGIYALSDKLRPLQDLRVSVSGGVHLDLVKRVMRDIDRSGQDPEDIIHQISETVYPMYKAFIEPDLRRYVFPNPYPASLFTALYGVQYALFNPGYTHYE